MGNLAKPAALVLVCVVAILGLQERLAHLTAAESKSENLPKGAGAEAGGTDRLREGTTVTEQIGLFKLTGDQLTFYSKDGSLRLAGLENLNLERIAKIVGENTEPLEWTVSGAVTEYQGANYLLIGKAVLKTKAARRGSPVKP